MLRGINHAHTLDISEAGIAYVWLPLRYVLNAPPGPIKHDSFEGRKVSEEAKEHSAEVLDNLSA